MQRVNMRRLWAKKRRERCSVEIPSLGGSQHRVCLVCGNAAALPNTFMQAEARAHFSYDWRNRK